LNVKSSEERVVYWEKRRMESMLETKGSVDKKKGLGEDPIPSPDGRHLAMLGVSQGSNVWVMENF
jgi:hypothetical protein